MRLEGHRNAGKAAKRDGWRDLALGRRKGSCGDARNGRKKAACKIHSLHLIKFIPYSFRFFPQVVSLNHE